MQKSTRWTGIAVVLLGMAMMTTSADGRTTDDPARKKLIPYYEAGPTKATIIGIQNMSPQEADTQLKNADVKDLQAFLAGALVNANAAGLIVQATWKDANNDGVVDPDETDPNIVTVNKTRLTLDAPDVTQKAAAEKALDLAKKLQYTGHLFIAVNVYDEMGMKKGSATLCLAENQFGYVSIQGAMGMMDSNQAQVISMDEDDIPATGYVKVVAEQSKHTACARPSLPVSTLPFNDARDALDEAGTRGDADSEVAAWTIIQDTGDGFFGTEVPTGTFETQGSTDSDNSHNPDRDDPTTPLLDESETLDCYVTKAEIDADKNDLILAEHLGNRDSCFGIIHERNQNARRIPTTANPAFYTVDTTGGTTVTARYDAGDESTIVVWLGHGEDTKTTRPSGRRMLNVQVLCEDGTVVGKTDIDGTPGTIPVPAPTKLTVIDPTGPELMEYTDMCDGDRGALQFRMTKDSQAGMVFTHISQMMGHYRMNFSGYSKTDKTTTCGDIDKKDAGNPNTTTLTDCM